MSDRKGLKSVKEYQAAILDLILALMDNEKSSKEEKLSIIELLASILRDYTGFGQPRLPLSVTMMLQYAYYTIILDYSRNLSSMVKQIITTTIEYNISVEYKKMISNGEKKEVCKKGLFSHQMLDVLKSNNRLRISLNPRVDKEKAFQIEDESVIVAKLQERDFNTKI